MGITEILLKWYDINKRDMPWRQTKDPYFIWLSEIILQQTRIDQGLPYYISFVTHFPDLKSLANADEKMILKLWQGLGYYSRALNLHAAAKQISEKFNGVFPSSYNEIRELKGIGDYTAAAVASLAFGLPYSVVDGNVIRFISRLYGITEETHKPEIRKKIKEYADGLLDRYFPGEFNQAMMEFGAIICKQLNPSCVNCGLREYCKALKLNLVNEIPAKGRRIIQRNRFFHYGLFSFRINSVSMIYVKRRDYKDIWRGLYDFPLIETSSEKEIVDFSAVTGWAMEPKKNGATVSIYGPYNHILTHQRLQVWFHHFPISGQAELDFIPVPVAELKSYAFPRVIDRFLSDVTFI